MSTPVSFVYNALTLAASEGFLVQSADGLNGIPIRSSIVQKTGYDGENLWAQNFSARVITLEGQIRGISVDDYFDKKARLIAALQPKVERQLDVTMWNGTTRSINAYVLQQPLIPERYGKIQYNDFLVQFFCQDPFFMGADEEVLTINTFSGAGGVLNGGVIPFVLVAPANSGTLTNDGDFETYPSIRIDGPFSSITITNTTVGQSVTLTIAIPDGSYVLIYRNIQGEFVLLNGTDNYRQYFPRNLFPIALGTNNIVVEGTGTNGNSQVTITLIEKFNTAA